MEFQYSTVIDPSTYDTEGLCDGIDFRRNNFTWLEDRGAIRAQADWTKYVSPATGHRGVLGPQYSLLSSAIPECSPERLEVISYALEFGFLLDDVINATDQEQGTIESNDMMQAFLEGVQTGKITKNDAQTKREGKRKIQSQLLLEMFSIDRERAIAFVKAWAEFAEVGSGRQHHENFATLEEYLPYRIVDAGHALWYTFITFGMGLNIPQWEREKCDELTQSATAALVLQNDLFSWEQEYATAQSNHQSHVTNALRVLMREHNIGIQEAQQMCRKLIKQHVSDYIQIVENVKHNESLSADLRKYIEAMQYTISGNIAWSMNCPRYHPQASLNETQLEWMHSGVPDKLTFSLPSPPASPEVLGSLSPSWSVHSDSSRSSTPPLEEPITATKNLLMNLELPSPPPPSEIVEAPYQYIASLPSKGIRDKFIDAVNQWLKVPENIVEQIKALTNRLHQASLLLDDFEDSSPLRRGKPAAHTIFGAPQAINSAGYCIVKAIGELQALGASQIITSKLILTSSDKILSLFKGQALDLHWTYNGICPTPAEYIQMIDCKTGAQFDLVVDMMLAHSNASVKPDLKKLTTLLGRYFQIADDYKNLVSADYRKQKGFCEDLDEGKYSLPLIHLLQSHPENLQLRNILSTRRAEGKMMYEQKVLVLEYLREAESLEYTHSVLEGLHAKIGQQIDNIEESFGETSIELRVLWELLRV
ncbi:hypothetical protein GYMLUDRAFT_205331 [Collybiopsis luxurians FD-317 M1]|uniref:(2E,6E)-farnesyl diphosphate synthase n=1 Tax=Collybiopsis luxurians FD-317 M1 TaxID=944289 RepID=A0A0D0C082_9AGAR|nr:hypothetical protein GYMLUDRAFT_205331 [Collybiopsis luxurians FD-317 M1]